MAIAAVQHGVVARRQLLAAGVTPDAVDWRVKRGWFRPVHRGVYLIGPVATPHAAEMAAVLACGESALLSHRSAGVLSGLEVCPPATNRIEVIDRTGKHRPLGVRVYRIRTVLDGEITRLDGIPATTPARTLFDLASVLDVRALERTLADALARRLTTTDAIRRVTGRRPGRRGTSILNALLEAGTPVLTRSEAEERFLQLIRQAQVERPTSNVVFHGTEVDFLWRSERLVVEIDGFAFHASRPAFERDRRRDAILAAAGYRVVRITWRRLVEEPIAVAAQIAHALAAGVDDRSG